MTPGPVAVIGAGPAGLTAGYLLAKQGVPVTVIESDPRYVGGISRTVTYRGYHFDIGGHRFFSKSPEIEALWSELLPHDLLERSRSSRIFYDGKFYSYPLKAGEALANLGFFQSALCVFSYASARLRPIDHPKNFEEWVINHFGRRLYRTFFKTYTEKVWGMRCDEISADWAAQRIKGLSLSKAILDACGLRRGGKNQAAIKTLIHTFRYPRLGPGMLWEAAAEKMIALGGTLRPGITVEQCILSPTGSWNVRGADAAGCASEFSAAQIISSAPLRQLINGLTPRPSERMLRAANALNYRDFILVALILKDRGRFNDNWIYIHDPGVKVARIQNFKAWSAEMAPDSDCTCYGMEYFCFKGDGLWNASDVELIELAKNELAALGLAQKEDLLDGCVVRQAKAYPVYDENYRDNVATIRSELARNYPGLHVVGRNGMHRYNNQDHSMMTALLCVENLLAGREKYDLWAVNEDAEYLEGGNTSSTASGLRSVPQR